MVVGLTVIQKGEYLQCGSDGTWTILQRSGDLFITMHIVVLILHTAIVVQTFYKLPKGHGMFKKKEGEEE